MHGSEKVIFSKLILLTCKIRRLELDDLENSIVFEEQRCRGGKYWCAFWEVLERQHCQSKGWIQGGTKEEAMKVRRGHPKGPVSPAQWERGTLSHCDRYCVMDADQGLYAASSSRAGGATWMDLKKRA